MMRHKNKIIAAVIILAVLAAAFLYGGNYNKGQGSGENGERTNSERSDELLNSEFETRNESTYGITVDQSAMQSEQTGSVGSDGSQSQKIPNSQEPTSYAGVQNQDITNSQEPASYAGAQNQDILNSQEPASDADAQDQEITNSEFTDPDSEEPTPTMEIDPETGKDRYQTTPAPEGRPVPVEPQDVIVGDGSFTVTLSVRCDNILDNMILLDREKHELVPDDGVIFPVTVVTAYEGESVFNVLQREMRRAGIHMTFRNTPIYNSAYITAINNLNEFDVGELSGWMYRVNGWYPNYGCSRYQLEPGDVIEWHFTCDRGRDLGEYSLASGWLQLDD